VNGFSPQVQSGRKNAVGAYGGGHFCSGALGAGLIREQSLSGTFWFFLVTKRTRRKKIGNVFNLKSNKEKK